MVDAEPENEEAQRSFEGVPSPAHDTPESSVDAAEKMDTECTQPLPTPPQQQPSEVIVRQETETADNSSPSVLSQDILQTYRNAIQGLNPNMPIFTLPMDDITNLNIHTLFPDLLMYEPPSDAFDDPYFDDAEYGRIVPISKLSTCRVVVNKPPVISRKRKVDGEQIALPEEPLPKVAAVLPRQGRYDNAPLISPLFAPRKIRDYPATQPRSPAQPVAPVQTSTWSEDDDVYLIQLILQLGFNWDLICDAFNSARSSISGTERRPWELYERWKQNNLTTLSGQVNAGKLPEYLGILSFWGGRDGLRILFSVVAYASKVKKDASKRQSSKIDVAKRRQRQYNVFEAIKRSQKKREEAQKLTSKKTSALYLVEHIVYTQCV